MDEQQQILAMILDAKAAGKNEDEIVEMLREVRDAQYKQDNAILENASEPTSSKQNEEIYEEIYEEVYEEINQEIYEGIDQEIDEIEWIFPDDQNDTQNEKLIDTNQTPAINNLNESSKEWKIGINRELTVDTSLDAAIDSPSGLAIVKTSQLGNKPLSQHLAQKRNNQSPLSILGAFVFLGAIVGVTLYQFFRLQPKPPNIVQEATAKPPTFIASDSSTISPNDKPLPTTVRPSDNLPPGCGVYSGSRESHIIELKTSKIKLGGLFPAECQSQLDELQFKFAIEKLAANDGDFQAAATMLCDITEAYFKNDQDPFRRPFLRDWSENNNKFNAWLEKHLASNDCPASNYLQ